MNNAFSNWAEEAILRHILKGSPGYTYSTNIFIGLAISVPTETNFNETAYAGYTRATLSLASASNRAIALNQNATFGTCTSGTTITTHWGIFDSFNGGNLIMYGSLSSAKNIVTNNTPVINSGYVLGTISSGYMSNSLANAILNHICGIQQLNQPTNLFYALNNTDITEASIGSQIADANNPIGSGYTRATLTGNPIFTISGSLAINSELVQFPLPAGSWGTITSIALLDSYNDGMLYYFNNGVTEQEVGLSDIIQVPQSSFQIVLE